MVDLVKAKVEDVEITEVTPEFNISSVQVGTLANGYKVLHVLFPKYLLKRLRSCNKDELLTTDGVKNIGLAGFRGFTKKELFATYPGLKGTTLIDDVEVPKLMPHRWNSKGSPHTTGYFVVSPALPAKRRVTIKASKKIKLSEFSVRTKWIKRMIKKEEIILAEKEEIAAVNQ